ncbi:hypothetical protein FRC03_001003 [Tulasnella sp. 419]|nr:hypothetical protein FRC03_001003 [Tulasnella sp. 419]
MDRSNSVSSQSSGAGIGGAFAYQTRLLERTSSLSRSSSQSRTNAAGILTPNGSTRRWTPSHRIGASVDSLRGRWEKTATQSTNDDTHKLGKSESVTSLGSPGSDERAATPPNQMPRYRLVDQPLNSQTSQTPTRSFRDRFQQINTKPKETQDTPPPTTPTALKRHTAPSLFPSPEPHSNTATPTSVRSTSPTRITPPSTERFSSNTTTPTNRFRTLSNASRDSNPSSTPPPKRLSAYGPNGISWESPGDRPPSAPLQQSRRTNTIDTNVFLSNGSPSHNSSENGISSPSRHARDSSPIAQPSQPSTGLYRSTYMAARRGAYPDNLGPGGRRKLGRHLPRIASGDGNEDFEEEKRQEEKRREQEEKERRLERERAMEKLEGQKLESPRSPVSPPFSPTKMAVTLSGPSDVQGVPGRLRFSRSTVVPNAPGAALPAKRRFGIWEDVHRSLLQAYEYLCHVGEAQQWIEGCLQEELGFGIVEMEEGLRNGVVLAKLARVWEGEALVRRIFEHPKLQYKHSDNINYFFVFVRRHGLPESFIFELTDLYEKKNIPKVIYCIHALSHLLARKGMAQRIGNLLGRLQFSDDQLQQTQKGLNAANVPMPNFGNIGKELAKDLNVEPEPEEEVETEEERIDRLLFENEDSIIKFQAIARGYMARKALRTQHARIRVAERSIVKLQARCHGVLSRRHVAEQRSRQMDLRPWVIALQAAARGVLSRRAWRVRIARIRYASRFAIAVQAQARGVLQRRQYTKLKGALRSSRTSIVKLQSLARAKIGRSTHKEALKSLKVPIVRSGVINLQAAARGALRRREIRKTLEVLDTFQMNIVGLQAHIRGVLVRKHVRAQLAKLDDAMDVVVRIQAACRAFLAKQSLLDLIRGLRKATPSIISLQAQARAMIVQRKRRNLQKALDNVTIVRSVGNVQALARAAITRKRRAEQKKQLEVFLPDVTGLQAVARGVLVRSAYWAWRDHLRASHGPATHLQALLRGVMQRRRFQQKMQHYRANLNKVVKIQALFRAKEQREQYRQLTMGTNVTVGTIKNFVHLLDDSEADFEDEIEVERLRKKVVEGIRENQALETDVSELDVKIALVVQNVKSFEEFVKARRRHGAETVAAHAARASVLAAHGDPFAGPNTLDHEAKRKLELYQQLFYLLQTHGEYLARLFFRLTRIDVPDKTKRLAERVILTLFGYGQDRREEYLFVKLFQVSIHEEIKAARSVAEIIHGHPMYVNVAVQYARPKQIAYVRETLAVVIREVIALEDLDLETDPVAIYKARVNEEEMRTGRQSSRPKNVDFHQAVDDPETRAEFIRHLQKLHALAKTFVTAIIQSSRRMPFGMRCIARDMLLALRIKFPNDSEETFSSAIGQLIYNRMINPAIVAPETYDIVPNTLPAGSRKNLAEIAKVLKQITSGQVFGEDTPCLTPLNSYVEEAIPQFQDWFLEVADVPDAETHFHAHEFLDATVQPKPIYISPNEVYSMHSLLATHIEALIMHREDPLRVILTELNGVPNLGSDELKDARDRAITLDLTNRFAHVEDPHADEKALWVQAKRGVLAILRVQPAKDLVESLMQPVTDEHEAIWEEIVEKELASDHLRQRKTRMPSTSGPDAAYRLEDIRSLSFRDVKGHAIYYLLELEKRGKVTRNDGYQGILNAIAGDVRSKHWKRVQRRQEMDSMSEALVHLRERKKHFEEQINSYNSYVETSMATLQRGKGKKRFVMPFTKQYYHQRDLQKSGKAPQFGSFRYSAQDFYDKGILISIDQTSPRQFDKIDIVISSNKAGVFAIEITDAHLGVVMGTTDVKMEDLLQAQFEQRVSLSLFDGLAKFNLNLLLYQINKKFYV